jgi:hypothetical protein
MRACLNFSIAFPTWPRGIAGADGRVYFMRPFVGKREPSQIEQEAFAKPVVACQDIQPWTELQRELFDETDVLDIEALEHAVLGQIRH